ncbi:MAG: ABC transporter permease [Actinomycetota bacterium]
MSTAEIFDRGYRRFDGERSGVLGAMRSVTWYTTKSMLGIGRKGRHKVFPVLIAIIAFLPTVIIFGIVALFGDASDGIRPDYYEFLGPSESFGFLVFAHFLYAVAVAPEAIVRDRRDGMLSLYLSTPLTRWTYLGSKTLAVAGTMSIVVLGPALLLLLGYTIQGQGPDGPAEWIEVFAKLLLGGFAIVAIYCAVSLAISSLTDRRAFASIAVLLALVGLGLVAGLLVEVAEYSPNAYVIDPTAMAFEFAVRLFGDESDGTLGEVSTGVISLGVVGWIVVGFGVLIARYRKLAAI